MKIGQVEHKVIRKPITYEVASSRLRYEPGSGHIFWTNCRQKTKNGTVAGYRGKQYIEVRIGERLILGHRLAWLLHYGKEPDPGFVLDHINMDGYDNRISNLRCVNHSINGINKDGAEYRGVCLCKQTGQWKATATHNRRQVWLGRFDTREAALAARKQCEAELYSGIVVPRGNEAVSRKLENLARNQPCYMRLPGICNFNNETTVLCHVRRGSLGGTGIKPLSICALPMCFDCHNCFDMRTKSGMSRDELDSEALRGLCQWHDYLLREGHISI